MNRFSLFQQETRQSLSRHPYWCHICRLEFHITISRRDQSIACPTCKGDFCEKIETTDPEYHPKEFIPFDGKEHIAHQEQEDNIRDDESSSSRDFLESDTESLHERNPTNQRRVHEPISAFIRDMRLISSYAEMDNLQITGSLIHRLVLREILGSLLPGHLGTSDEDSTSSFDAILQHIIETDPNTYGTPPVSKKILDKLPTIKMTKEILVKEGYEDCAVCKEEFKIDEELNQIQCKHTFHKDCIVPWLKQHNSCPVCRFELPTDDIDYENRKLFQTINNHTQNAHNQNIGHAAQRN